MFKGIKKVVTTYIKKYVDCQRNKYTTHKKYREI
jgi:hypothetical protein